MSTTCVTGSSSSKTSRPSVHVVWLNSRTFGGDAKVVASRPCAAEADPEAALARAAAAAARFAEADFVSGDDVRLAELRRRDGVGD